MSDSDDSFFDDESDQYAFSDGDSDDMSVEDIEDMVEEYSAEHCYFDGKTSLKNDVEKAKQCFAKIIADGGATCWVFKAHKQLAKHANDKEVFLPHWTALCQEFITDTGLTTVPPAKQARSLSKIIAGLPHRFNDAELSTRVAQAAVDAIGHTSHAAGMQLLHFVALARMADTALERGDLARVSSLVQDLSSLSNLSSSQKLEIKAMQIKLATIANDVRVLRPLVEAATDLMSAAVPHPAIFSTVAMASGSLALHASDFEKAKQEFITALGFYEVFDHSAAVHALQLASLATLLAENQARVFESQQVEKYLAEDAIAPFVQLDEACRSGVQAAVIAAAATAKTVVSTTYHSFIDQAVERSLLEALERYVKPYSIVPLASISNMLSVPLGMVQSGLVRLILSGRVIGRIDVTRGMLVGMDSSQQKMDMDLVRCANSLAP